MDKIDFREAIGPDIKPYFSDSEPVDKNNKSNKNVDNKPFTINKAAEYNPNGVEKLCKACIESKHIRIIKSQKMMPISKKLQEVHADLWSPHKPAYIMKKNYVGLLLDKFTRKLCILLLKSKDKFFDALKLWLPRTEARKKKLDRLWVDNRKEFISAALQSFCQE